MSLAIATAQPWLPLGDFGATYAFSCNATICYGSDGAGATDKLFKSFQRQLNLVGPLAGAKTISVDGFIGKDTLATWNAVASSVSGTTAATKEQLASWVTDVLSPAYKLASEGAVSTKPAGTAATPTTSPVAVPPGAAVVTMPTGRPSGAVIGVLAGVAALGLVGAALYSQKGGRRRRRGGTARRGRARRRRR